MGKSFSLDAHIKRILVLNVMKYNHQICIPKTNPGTMIIALENQAIASTVLYGFQYSRVNHILKQSKILLQPVTQYVIDITNVASNVTQIN